MKNHIVIGRASLHERIERKNGQHLCIKTTFSCYLTFMGGLPVLLGVICLNRYRAGLFDEIRAMPQRV